MLYSRSQIGKFLGSCIIDEQLKWKEQNDAQCNTLLNMFNALVLPYFTYCSNVWSDGSRVHIEKLHKLHK